ncbi:MAG: hypothetical protein ACYYK0_00780 [Candidatus Eutrophobiaceae bacterium]
MIWGIAAVVFWACLAPPLPVQAEEDEVELLWRSGKNQYVRLAEQDNSLGEAVLPNDHPISLDAVDVAKSLEQLQRFEENWFSESELRRVMSKAQIYILSKTISRGLAEANPKQDMLFVLGAGSSPDNTLSLSGTLFVAGRAFYQGGMLNIIFGDFRRARDKGMEAMAGQYGEYEITYQFNHGNRAESNSPFPLKDKIFSVEGIANQVVDGETRTDWLVIDLGVVKQKLAQIEAEEKRKTPAGLNARQLQEANTDRLKMRREMARMKKELSEIRLGAGGGGGDIQARMKTLEQLRKDDLISEEEYQSKRKAILDNI